MQRSVESAVIIPRVADLILPRRPIQYSHPVRSSIASIDSATDGFDLICRTPVEEVVGVTQGCTHVL
jgi:hypothetical protein